LRRVRDSLAKNEHLRPANNLDVVSEVRQWLLDDPALTLGVPLDAYHVSKRTALHEDVHLPMLCKFEDYPDINQRQVGHEFSVSMGTVNCFLKALVHTAFVNMHNLTAAATSTVT
jgi:hypothetical protein